MPKTNDHERGPAKSMVRPLLDVTAFRGKWVAIDAATYRVVGHGSSLDEARQSVPSIASREPVLYFVPESDAFLVGRSA